MVLNIAVADVSRVGLDELLAAHDYVAHEHVEGGVGYHGVLSSLIIQ
jgi:hypothetical protein